MLSWRSVVGVGQMVKIVALRIRCAILDPGHYKKSDQVELKEKCGNCKAWRTACQKCALRAPCECGVAW